MDPTVEFSPRNRLLGMLKFMAIVIGVTIIGVVVLMNVKALSPTNKSNSNGQYDGPPPSGLSMPVGDIPGWHQVFTEDFTSTKLDGRKWHAYSGPAGGVPNTLWDTSYAVVDKGMLRLRNTRAGNSDDKWISAGVSSAPALHQTYGKYLVRFRIDKGEGITGIILLWPSDNKWPPEIDFAENGGGERNYMNATLHYGSDNQKIQHTVRADFSQWHTIGVEWLPGQLRYTLDDTVWATVNSSRVPTVPMALDMQTQTGICGNPTNPCPNNTTPHEVGLHVDWAVVYAPEK